MSKNWRTLATARTDEWTRCPWQNTPSSRLPGVWSGATDGTSERFTAKANRPSWRTSLEQRLPLRQPLKLSLALPLALPRRQALKPPQAVAVDEAQPLALPLALPLRRALKPPQAVAVDEAQSLRQPLALPLGEAEGEADSLPPQDVEWWTSTLWMHIRKIRV